MLNEEKSSPFIEKEDNDENKISVEKKKSLLEYFSQDSIVLKTIFLIGILTIFFGAWKIVLNIKKPFVVSNIELEDKAEVIKYLNRLKDTDGDGISDYEEVYVYGTSPYLTDSDSDGVSDYDQIINESKYGTECVDDSCVVDLEAETENIDSENSFTPEKIKELLIQSGYSESMVNKLSEDDLNKIYNEVIKATNDPDYTFDDSQFTKEKDNSVVEKPLDVNEEELNKLKNLSIEEIKKLMIQSGAKESDIIQIPDNELRTMYLKALEEVQTKE